VRGKIGKVIFKIIIAAMFICIIYLLIAKGITFPGENVWNNEEIAQEDVGNVEKEEEKEESEKRVFQVVEEVTFGP